MSTFYQVLIDNRPLVWSGDEKSSWDNLGDVERVLRDLNHVNPRKINVIAVRASHSLQGYLVSASDATIAAAEYIIEAAVKDNTIDADTWPPTLFGEFAYFNLASVCDDIVANATRVTLEPA